MSLAFLFDQKERHVIVRLRHSIRTIETIKYWKSFQKRNKLWSFVDGRKTNIDDRQMKFYSFFIDFVLIVFQKSIFDGNFVRSNWTDFEFPFCFFFLCWSIRTIDFNVWSVSFVYSDQRIDTRQFIREKSNDLFSMIYWLFQIDVVFLRVVFIDDRF